VDILIIDDEPAICAALSDLLEKEGYSAGFATSAREGMERVGEARVVLLDLRIPGVVEFDLLDGILKQFPRVPVIVVTAHGTIPIAVEAMKLGAFDFLVKPPDQDALLTAVDRALAEADIESEVSELYYELPEGIVLQDPRSQELLDTVRKFAPLDLTVLLHGETGVGKEVFAKLLHQWSGRASGPLIKINCAAIPENLFESELFGHERGAFSGADATKPGRVEIAAGGTLFLDEIGELPQPAQAKLLQFLQDQTFERVGGLRTLKADVRIVTATNRDLADREGGFRRDLYYRIAQETIRIPPLRERPGDIAVLAEHFRARFAAKYRKKARFEPGAVEQLCAYAWPGNVRELEHAILRVVVESARDGIPAERVIPQPPEPSRRLMSLRDRLGTETRAAIEDALGQTGGNKTRAAKLLGISRRHLHNLMRNLGML